MIRIRFCADLRFNKFLNIFSIGSRSEDIRESEASEK